jgi:hypothetical protein
LFKRRAMPPAAAEALRVEIAGARANWLCGGA